MIHTFISYIISYETKIIYKGAIFSLIIYILIKTCPINTSLEICLSFINSSSVNKQIGARKIY